jgi:hypothetical protein
MAAQMLLQHQGLIAKFDAWSVPTGPKISRKTLASFNRCRRNRQREEVMLMETVQAGLCLQFQLRMSE